MNDTRTQKPPFNKGMYPGYMGQQQNNPYMQQQGGMNPQMRSMMSRYPNPNALKRPPSAVYGQGMMGSGHMQQQQQGQYPHMKSGQPYPPQYQVRYCLTNLLDLIFVPEDPLDWNFFQLAVAYLKNKW